MRCIFWSRRLSGTGGRRFCGSGAGSPSADGVSGDVRVHWGEERREFCDDRHGSLGERGEGLCVDAGGGLSLGIRGRSGGRTRWRSDELGFIFGDAGLACGLPDDLPTCMVFPEDRDRDFA